jgi:hypothetical protein
MVKDTYAENEWTVEEWMGAWNIRVGTVYSCRKCGSMIIVTKGGVGVLEPKCCGRDMAQVSGRENA